tara:strand:- start:12 stop:512 length:501 start_codon:yes stop_codon:yes gene_type:complete
MRNYKIKKCTSCTDEKKIHSKGMCQKCYSKYYRQTPTGKIAYLKYSKTKGKEALKRYYDKNRKPKEPKITKYCECGSVVLAKDLCYSCYHQKRYALKKGVDFVREKKEKKVVSDNQFLKLIELVCDGIPLYKALAIEGVANFYDIATEIQKTEIKLYKNFPINEFY